MKTLILITILSLALAVSADSVVTTVAGKQVKKSGIATYWKAGANVDCDGYKWQQTSPSSFIFNYYSLGNFFGEITNFFFFFLFLFFFWKSCPHRSMKGANLKSLPASIGKLTRLTTLFFHIFSHIFSPIFCFLFKSTENVGIIYFLHYQVLFHHQSLNICIYFLKQTFTLTQRSFTEFDSWYSFSIILINFIKIFVLVKKSFRFNYVFCIRKVASNKLTAVSTVFASFPPLISMYLICYIIVFNVNTTEIYHQIPWVLFLLSLCPCQKWHFCLNN